MTWISIGALAIGCYFFKALGVFAGRHIRLSGVGGHALSNLTPAALSGLIMVQTFDGGGTLAIGAVTAGVAAGGIAACVRLPFPVVLICASAVTAVLRLL